MFVDVARITVKAGNGGNGCISFRREKYIAAGGPDGGDGGNGGSVIFVADSSMSTLMDFKYRKKYVAQNGEDGKGSKMSGKKGEDLIIRVPVGTLIKDCATGKVIADLSEKGKTFTAVKGGKGGWGNARFATATRQAPNFAKSGRPGRERELELEVKLRADVGLIGFPNVGKSTLLSVVSDARPKIADYHFTTLVPNLGVAKIRDSAIVIADIPGIIEGAHEGTGLGIAFLRHIERTRLLIHVVDVSGIEGRNPVEDFEKINSELAAYSKALSQKPQIIAANKTDISTAALDEFAGEMEKRGYRVFPVSAATNKGIDKLLDYAYNVLQTLPAPEIEVEDDDFYEGAKDGGYTVDKIDGVFTVEGEVIYNLVNSINFSDNESLGYFQRALRRLGVIDALEAAGIEEGDIVRLFDIEFEYNR
jgi:GTP-binding protein